MGMMPIDHDVQVISDNGARAIEIKDTVANEMGEERKAIEMSDLANDADQKASIDEDEHIGYEEPVEAQNLKDYLVQDNVVMNGEDDDGADQFNTVILGDAPVEDFSQPDTQKAAMIAQ